MNKKYIRSMLLLALLAVARLATAMTFHAQPPVLYLGGAVVASDWAAWEEAMARFSNQIDTVVLHDSAGGDSTAGRKIGVDIRKRKLATAVYGHCASACANIFLGGVTRQFAAHLTPLRTELGFHGSYNKSTQSVNRKRSGEYFVLMTDGKMDEDLIERFMLLENKRGLLLFVHPDQRVRHSDPLAMLCKGDEDRMRGTEGCERLADVDALSEGVVTTWATRTVKVAPHPQLQKGTFKSWDESKADKKGR
jgi:hypothetical protein